MPDTPRLRALLISLLGIYLFVYPWSILLVSLDRVPVWGTWMGGVLLIVQGALMGLWLVANYRRHGLLASLLLLLLGWFVEHIGVTTGFPFGTYLYTDELGMKLVGVVPLAMPFAWLLVVPAAIGITDHLMNRASRDTPLRTLPKVLGAACFAVLLDVTIEPVAVHINGYWVWNTSSGGYYGVPISNFAAWWVTSVLLIWLVLLLQHRALASSALPPRSLPPASASASDRHHDRFTCAPRDHQPCYPWMPPLLYMLNLPMFVLVNMAHAQHTAAAIGGLILSYLAFDWLRPLLLRRWPGAGRQHPRGAARAAGHDAAETKGASNETLSAPGQ